MRKKSKSVDADWEAAYDLPAELDLKKLRVVGVGLGALRKHVAAKHKMVELDADVAKEFPTSQSVNDGLRTLRDIRRMVQQQKRKKTA